MPTFAGRRAAAAAMSCALVLAVSGLVLLLPATVSRADEAYDLSRRIEDLPYRTLPLVRSFIRSGEDYRLGFILTDTDGDGRDELVSSNGKHLLGSDAEDFELKPSFQINQAPGWRYPNPVGDRLAVPTDLNHDNIAELNVAVVADDGSQWRFQTIDVATEETVLDVPLPSGADRFADGVWDGGYVPIGLVADADGRGNPAVVLLCTVAYDASGRGAVAVDPRDGRIVWQYECGPNPLADSAVIADLDDDGREEIVFFGSSPDNLHGTRVNGISDNRSCFIVLSDRGDLMWYEELGGKSQSGSVAVFDFDGDGVEEIVTTTASGRVGETHKLIIWDFNRREAIVTKRQGSRFLGLAIVPDGVTGGHWLFAGSNDGYVTRYRYEDRRLVQDKRILTGYPSNAVTGALDILPAEGPEILVDLGGHDFVVFDGDLEALAFCSTDEKFSKRFPWLWERSSREASLVVGDNRGLMLLDFEKNPRSFAGLLIRSAVALIVLLAVLLAYRVGLQKGRRSEPPPAAAEFGPDPEELFRVWRQLDDVKHERFLEANRGLKRLVWLLEAYTTDLGASESLRERIGQLLEDFSESVQPRLMQILRRARQQEFAPELVEETARAFTAVVRGLEKLDPARMTVEAVEQSNEYLKTEVEKVADGFVALWQSLRRYFSTDPVHMLQGMLMVREAEFQRLGVTTRLEGVDGLVDPVCLVENSSLHFVFDNLLSNALRAMKDAPERILTAEFERERREMTIRITDTGKGIAPDDRENIFNGRTSDRGGGTGLFRSAEKLRKWGAEIYLAGSAPGKGSTFVVKLRTARDEPKPRTLKGKG